MTLPFALTTYGSIRIVFAIKMGSGSARPDDAHLIRNLTLDFLPFHLPSIDFHLYLDLRFRLRPCPCPCPCPWVHFNFRRLKQIKQSTPSRTVAIYFDLRFRTVSFAFASPFRVRTRSDRRRRRN